MLLMMGRVVGKAYYCSMRFQQVRAYKGPAEAVLLFTFCLQRQYEYILRGLATIYRLVLEHLAGPPGTGPSAFHLDVILLR